MRYQLDLFPDSVPYDHPRRWRPRRPGRRARGAVVEGAPLLEWRPPGLDLRVHELLVRRIYRRRWRGAVRAAGLDVDDVYQELLLSIERRNRGAHPYDPSRSSPSNWIFQVCRSVVVNQIAKARRRSWEVLGSSEDPATWDTAAPPIY